MKHNDSWKKRFERAAVGGFTDEHKRPGWLQAAAYLDAMGYPDAAGELERRADVATDRFTGYQRRRPEWLDRDTPETRALRAAARRCLWAQALAEALLELEAIELEARLGVALARLGAPPALLGELLELGAEAIGELESPAALRWARAERLRFAILSGMSKRFAK